MAHMTTYIFAYLGSAYLALALTPLVIWLAMRIKAVDYPGVRSVHRLPIPRIGGVAIYLATMAMLVPCLLLGNTIGDRFRELRLEVVTLLVCGTAIFVIGLVDDVKGLPARFKFAVESLGAVALCLAGVKIGRIELSGGMEITLGWLSWPVTVLWIVGVTNAVNMSDGLDGLAAGIAAIACGVIAVFAVHSSTYHVGTMRDNDVMMALFALTLLGSLSGFLFFNFNPAKVFMGDCGSLFLGFTIAAASVMCVSKSATLVGLALPALALGIPIFDTLFSMLRRFFERRSLFAPDRSHFHHHLLELGLTQRRAVIIIYAATLLATSLGLLMLANEHAGALVVFAGGLFLLLVPFRIVGTFRLDQIWSRLQRKYRFHCQESSERRVFENLQLRFGQVHDSGQWEAAVGETVEKMDFAWISLRTTHKDGRVEEDIWRPPNGRPSLRPLVTMSFPLLDEQTGLRHQIEIAVIVNGSLEAAGRRAMLFARLMDEYAAGSLGLVNAEWNRQGLVREPVERT